MMRGPVIIFEFLLFGLLYVGPPMLALQSCGLELGDFDTGSMPPATI